CYKCQTPIEPQIMEQWFVKMKPLAEKALKAVEKKQIKFIPEQYKKVFIYWMKNTIDWNISRQIVWGISIPARLCRKCPEAVVTLEEKEANCPKCGGPMEKDRDTFDTWFSSGQWPFLALDYPEGSDYKTFYPTDVMETGHDLIFKWVPRMVIFGLYLDGRVPFHTVYLHGLVNDAQGRKMSKSKGNIINPIELGEKYGTDALRMALIVGNTPGTDLALAEEKIKGYKHFANKIWNISRFVLSNLEEKTLEKKPTLVIEDKKIVSELNSLIKTTTTYMNSFKFYLAAEKIYHYLWHTFADIIIERIKERLKKENDKDWLSAQWTMFKILETNLKLLHPFAPFVTEEIWSMMPKKNKDSLLIEEWPGKIS
ncbi:MAG: valyl-tRNA synthetase, partial [Parcubacteria group bacterium Gr01-1014_107]